MAQVKYIAQLNGVRELALQGAADPAWWRDHMAGEGLEPVEANGCAQLLVTGLDARWMGIPFRDLSVAVAARRSGSEEEGLLFARAFNTSRFLVFFERLWFGLPYSRRAVRVALGEGASMRLGEEDVLGEMAAREPGAEREMAYEGPLFLPGRRWLMVHAYGPTSIFEFDPARDRFEVAAGCADPVLAGLRASRFRGLQWHVRESATHARSRTFRRQGVSGASGVDREAAHLNTEARALPVLARLLLPVPLSGELA